MNLRERETTASAYHEFVQKGKWSERRDSNSRPLVPQTSALTGLRHVPTFSVSEQVPAFGEERRIRAKKLSGNHSTRSVADLMQPCAGARLRPSSQALQRAAPSPVPDVTARSEPSRSGRQTSASRMAAQHFEASPVYHPTGLQLL